MRSLTSSIENGTAGSNDVMYVYSYSITLAFGAVIASQIGTVAEIALFLLIVYVPLFQMLFGTTAIHMKHLALLLVCPAVLIALEEIRKWFARRLKTA